jgi:hypothetical protein
MDADLDTLATALYVRVDDALKDDPGLAPWRPAVGIEPKLTDAELATVAVLQALLGFTSETRWLRYARHHLAGLFPYLPRQSGYNRRLRTASGLLQALIRVLAVDTRAWCDDTWIIDSTPVECGRSRPTARRSDLAGWAGYGYCASHSRYFWGLRLHLICTPGGLPITYALAHPKLDERDVARDLLDTDPTCFALEPVRPSSPTRATPAASSSRSSPTTASACCAPPSNGNRPAPGPDCSNRSARSSSPSTTR